MSDARDKVVIVGGGVLVSISGGVSFCKKGMQFLLHS